MRGFDAAGLCCALCCALVFPATAQTTTDDGAAILVAEGGLRPTLAAEMATGLGSQPVVAGPTESELSGAGAAGVAGSVIVPTPGSLALIAFAGVVVVGRRRRP